MTAWFTSPTQAEQHYPLDESIEPVLEAEKDGDVWTVLDRLDDVWSGEAGPYAFEQILMTDADESRRRHLFASASPKHQPLTFAWAGGTDDFDSGHVTFLSVTRPGTGPCTSGHRQFTERAAGYGV